jgi:VIT1/CCC1 family predicted Fe2+/Mn2+ transporter
MTDSEKTPTGTPIDPATDPSSPLSSLYVRNIIFGVEDSLVSTVGLLAGIAIGDITAAKIFMIGIVYLFVEGFSMAAGSYLSEHSAQEYETGKRTKSNEPLYGAIVMFLAFLIAGFIPLLPYLFLSLSAGIIASIIFSLIFLAILGFTQAKFSKVTVWPSIIRMVVIGGIAIILGVVIGKVLGVS